MRIIAGVARGRRLVVPAGDNTRPTPDRVREALFSMLGGTCAGHGVLDLFAGSGALGLEALSRGAQHATFVEKHRKAVEAIEQNIAAIHEFAGKTELLRSDVLAALGTLSRTGRTFDLVFMDPPYAAALVPRVLMALEEHALLAADARVVADHGKGQPVPERVGRLALTARRAFGEVAIAIWQRGEDAP